MYKNINLLFKPKFYIVLITTLILPICLLLANVFVISNVVSIAVASDKTNITRASFKGSTNNNINTPGIAAIVNNKAITDTDVEGMVKLMCLTSGLPNDEATRNMLKPQALQKLVLELLQRQTADMFKLSATQKEIDAALKNIAEQSNKSIEELTAMLKKEGILKILSDSLNAQISWTNYIRAAYGNRAKVTEQELKKLLAKIEENEKKTKYSLMEIVLYDSPQINNKNNAEQILGQLRESKGLIFTKIAQQLSQAPSQTSGGKLGWQTLDQMDEITKKTVENMKIGDICLVRLPNCYRIIRLADLKLPGKPACSDTKVSYYQVEVKISPEMPEEEQMAVAALIESMRNTKNCQTFINLAQSNPQYVELTEVKDTPLIELPDAIRNLLIRDAHDMQIKQGQVKTSDPIRMSESTIGIIKLCSSKAEEKPAEINPKIVENFEKQRRFANFAVKEIGRIQSSAYIKYMHKH